MKRFILSLREKITSRPRSGSVGFALLLALLSALSYGTSILKSGIYWDDWAFIWTRLAVGYAGLLRHFSFSEEYLVVRNCMEYIMLSKYRS